MMFKILVLQALYSLSDEGCEFQIKDRLSFQRFLGLGLDGRVPDATTVWLFRERLVRAKAIDKLFARFDAALTDRGYLAMGGQIIDATVGPAPKQRNTDEEGRRQRPKGGNAAIKQGKIPERWKEKPAKIRQKDRDARWTVKYSKAKIREGADPNPRASSRSTLPSRCSATASTRACPGDRRGAQPTSTSTWPMG